MGKKGKKPSGNTIALNKKAKFDFALEERIEAGLSLLGWEVKSLREGKAQLTEQKGYTVVATALYWKSHLVKCEIALGKGKQKHDKRETEKERDWNRQKRRILQEQNK